MHVYKYIRALGHVNTYSYTQSKQKKPIEGVRYVAKRGFNLRHAITQVVHDCVYAAMCSLIFHRKNSLLALL